MEKEKTVVTFLTLFAILGGCSKFTPSTQATITPIIVDTLSAFNSPEPTFTRPPTSTRDTSPTNTFIPTPDLLVSTSTITPTLGNPPTRNPALNFPDNLVLDEWQLAENSRISRYSFVSLQGAAEEILARYDHMDVSDHFPSPLIQGFDKVMLNGRELVTDEEVVDSQVIIHVLHGGKEISRINAGYVYSRPNVWRVWTYQNEWILEYVSVFKDPYDRFYTLGNIVWNGESLNNKFGYQESFGLSAINGRVLYFFRRNDRIGVSYHGNEYNLDYESVTHYACCEIGYYINPDGIGVGLGREQNLSFFAKRNGNNYFVVLWAK